MKSIRSILGGLAIIGGLIGSLNFAVHAQTIAGTVQSISAGNVDVQSVLAQARALAAEEPVLEQSIPVTTNQSSEELPSGTYWYLQNAGPPTPFDPFPDLPVYVIDPTKLIFIVDDSSVDYPALRAQQEEQAEAMHSLARAMGLEMDSQDIAGSSFTIDTNALWLEIKGMTNVTASLVIHPPWDETNDVYDLLYCTNLAPPISWQWLLRSNPGQTNLVVPNATDAQGFYRLGLPNDLIANDSLGTNFWLTFIDSLDNLSLYITSSMGSTGTVTFPGIVTNGSILTVTGCGYTNLNGTYLLTTVSNEFVGSAYVKGTLQVGQAGDWWLFNYDSGSGTYTWFYVKPDADLNGTNWQAYLVGETNSPPTTSCALLPLIESFTVAPGQVTNLPVPLSGPGNDDIEINSIHITTSQPVSVYGINYWQFESTAFTGYPVPLLGTNYCVMARPSYIDNYRSEFAIVATADNTTVTITPSATADLAWDSGTNSYTTNMQAGQTYMLISSEDMDDVTGTFVTSDKPIGVFAGTDDADVPDDETFAANPLIQEQLPIDSWGKQILGLSFAGRTNGDSYRVLAAYSNTVVTISGVVVTIVDETDGPPWSVTTSNEVMVVTNQAGQFYDIIVDGPVEFQSSQPIQVAQFANGTYFDHGNNPFEGDPCEILLPPIGYYLETNTVVTLPDDGITGDFDQNFLNLIVAQSAITNTLVDGSSVASTNFVPIRTSGYYGAQLTMTNSGVHTITSSKPIGVQVYGWGFTDAYSYFGGVVK